jgi:hypothetical protein
MLYLLFIDSTWYGLLFIWIFYFSITPCILKYKVSKPKVLPLIIGSMQMEKHNEGP